jgi:hypothetical protein
MCRHIVFEEAELILPCADGDLFAIVAVQKEADGDLLPDSSSIDYINSLGTAMECTNDAPSKTVMKDNKKPCPG